MRLLKLFGTLKREPSRENSDNPGVRVTESNLSTSDIDNSYKQPYFEKMRLHPIVLDPLGPSASPDLLPLTNTSGHEP